MTHADLKTGAQNTARELRDKVSDAAEARAEAARDEFAEQADRTADQTHEAAQAYDNDSLQAQVLGQLADNIDALTDQMRRRSIPEMAEDAASLARRHPALVLGGAALAGFALARFLKASPEPVQQSNQVDPWTGHLDDRGLV